MSSYAELPLKTPRLVLLFLTWCAGVIGGSVGINAVVRRNQSVWWLQSQVAPAHIVVDIDTSNLLNPGVVLAVGCTLLSIVASIIFGLLLLDIRRSKSSSQSTPRQPLSTRTLPIQWMSLAFMNLWLLGAGIPVLMTALNGSPVVTAFLGGNQLADSLVRATEHSLGVQREYWTQDFVRLQVIPPWIALGLGLATMYVTLSASRSRSSLQETHQHVVSSDMPEADSMTEKPVIGEREAV